MRCLLKILIVASLTSNILFFAKHGASKSNVPYLIVAGWCLLFYLFMGFVRWFVADPRLSTPKTKKLNELQVYLIDHVYPPALCAAFGGLVFYPWFYLS